MMDYLFLLVTAYVILNDFRLIFSYFTLDKAKRIHDVGKYRKWISNWLFFQTKSLFCDQTRDYWSRDYWSRDYRSRDSSPEIPVPRFPSTLKRVKAYMVCFGKETGPMGHCSVVSFTMLLPCYAFFIYQKHSKLCFHTIDKVILCHKIVTNIWMLLTWF